MSTDTKAQSAPTTANDAAGAVAAAAAPPPPRLTWAEAEKKKMAEFGKSVRMSLIGTILDNASASPDSKCSGCATLPPSATVPIGEVANLLGVVDADRARTARVCQFCLAMTIDMFVRISKEMNKLMDGRIVDAMFAPAKKNNKAVGDTAAHAEMVATSEYYCDHTDAKKTQAAIDARDWLCEHKLGGGGGATLSCSHIMTSGPRKGGECMVNIACNAVSHVRCVVHHVAAPAPAAAPSAAVSAT